MENNTDSNNCTALIVKNPLSNTQHLILYLYIYSFIGWLLETVYAFCIAGHFVKRGFLFGPACPIYGFGAVIMLLSISKYKDSSAKTFFSSAIVFSLFEYIVGFILEAILRIRLWDYTNEFLNLNGRISILYALFWGIAGIIFINHIHPFVKRKIEHLLNKLNSITQVNIITIITIIFISDFILSCIKYIRLI